MGERGPAFSRAQGRRTALEPATTSASTSTSPRCSTSPGPGGDRRNRTRLRIDGRPRSRRPRCLSRPAAGRRGWPRRRSTSRGSVSARVNTDFAVQRIGLSKVDPAAGRRGALPPLLRGRRRPGDAQHRDLPGLLRKPAAFTRSIATGELRGRLGFEGVSITDALETVAVRDFGRCRGGGPRRRPRRRRPPPLPEPGAPASPSRPPRGLRSGALSRAAFDESAGRVLRLRHSLGTAASDSQR